MGSETKMHYRTCNLCEAMCGIEIEYQDKEVVAIRGDKDDPFSRGHICPKAVALKDIYEDKDRLKHPIRRTANGWKKITWEEAYKEIAQNLKSIQTKYGNNAVGIYAGNPNVHNMGSILFGTQLFKLLRTQNRFSATSADQLPHHVASRMLFGHYFLLPVPDIDRTEHMLIFGANPIISNGSIMSSPDIKKRLKDIQKKGGKIVVIDPRYSETAALADEHYFIKPARDVYLLLSLVHTVFKEKKVQLRHLEQIVKRLEEVQQLVRPYSPEYVEKIIGIPSDKIKMMAREFMNAERAVCYGRMGISTQAYGGLCLWLVSVLNIITGNMDRDGGMMFTAPAFDTIAQGKTGKFGRWKSRVKQLPEFFGELPVSTMLDEMITEGEGQIKMMFTTAGNPILSVPNGGALDEAFSNLEYMVSIDIYLNETTRHANIILPPTTGLETDHFDVVFHSLAIRNTVKYSKALFEKEETQQHDWQIFQDLVAAISGSSQASLSPEMIVAFGLKSGKYQLDLETVKKEVHGIDLGALEPCLPDRLFTKDKKIDLAPAFITKDLKRLERDMEALEPSDTFPLLLIGRRQLRTNNSWMHNSYRMVKGRNRCTLLIHPSDADFFGIKDMDWVKVTSKVGDIKIQVEVSQEVMQGVVSIPHGWGHNKKGMKLRIAEQYAGASINDLTDNGLIDALTGNAAFSGVAVKLTLHKAQEEPIL